MAVSRLRFTGSGDGTHYIDLARALSLQERKLIRQKQVFTVYGGFFVDTPATSDVNSRININSAPMTWPNKLAVNRGFRLWKKMIAKTLSEATGVQTGKYNDFKIHLDRNVGTGSYTYLMPKDAAGHELKFESADWDYSLITSEDPSGNNAGGTDPDQFYLQIVGPHSGSNMDPGNPGGYTRIGLLHSWVESRPHPQDQTPTIDAGAVASDPLSNMFDSGDSDDNKIAVIESEGDHPPYDNRAMFGNSIMDNGAVDDNLQRQSVAVATTSSPVAPIHGFQALCGLLQIEVTANSAWELVIDVETQGERF